MHAIDRPESEPLVLTRLRGKKSSDFGPMGAQLDKVFMGACAFCERTVNDDDVMKRDNGLFYCDHFRPRHAFPGLIYDWDNLLYVCGECAGVKGGQWPMADDPSNQFLEKIEGVVVTEYPDSVRNSDTDFCFNLSNGYLKPGNVETPYQALRMIGDLALNEPEKLQKIPRWNIASRQRGPNKTVTLRRTNLAEARLQRLRRLERVLILVSSREPDNAELLKYVIGEFTHPSVRFSSICKEFIAQSKYRLFLEASS